MNTFLIKNTLKYYLSSRHSRGHGIHSPFVYEFIRNILIDKKKYSEYTVIEQQRKLLLHNSNSIEVIDLGAGSKNYNTSTRKISDIAISSLSPVKYAQLLFRIARYYSPQNILEMGTSLGISGAYLALANSEATCISLEGSPCIAEQARYTWENLGITNIECIVGDFTTTLQQSLEKLGTVNFVFIDGNHQKQPTLDYFEQVLPYCNDSSILIFDDIYWSKGMCEAWEHIKQDTRVSITIDLCKLGLVFFRKGIIKQNFEIRF